LPVLCWSKTIHRFTAAMEQPNHRLETMFLQLPTRYFL